MVTPPAPAVPPLPRARRDLRDAPFLVAARGGRPARVPVWFMRQAGRSLPEYRALRAGTGMLAACLTPELACEITLQPVRRHGVDAAILFSDIVVPLHAAGIGVDIVPGTGPGRRRAGAHGRRRRALPSPAPSSRSDRSPRPSACWCASSATTPLIGFAGAPFTLASYLVEGGPSRNHERTKALMHAAPEVWHAPDGAARRHHRDVPARAGRRRGGCRAAVRLVGGRALAARLPRVRAAALRAGARRAGRRRRAADPLRGRHRRAAGRDGRGGRGRRGGRLAGAAGRGRPRGPAAASRCRATSTPRCCSPTAATVASEARRIVAEGRAAPGHVFNLGHGVLPGTDPDVLTRLVELVHGLEP